MKLHHLVSIFLFYTNGTLYSRRLRCAGHVARIEKGRCTFKILTSKPIGKSSLGIGGQIKMDLTEIGSGSGSR